MPDSNFMRSVPAGDPNRKDFKRESPQANDCFTEVLLDFCTRVTFLRSVPDKYSSIM